MATLELLSAVQLVDELMILAGAAGGLAVGEIVHDTALRTVQGGRGEMGSREEFQNTVIAALSASQQGMRVREELLRRLGVKPPIPPFAEQVA